MPKLPFKTMSDEQGPSEPGKGKERDEEEQEDRQPGNQWSRVPTKRERMTSKAQ